MLRKTEDKKRDEKETQKEREKDRWGPLHAKNLQNAGKCRPRRNCEKCIHSGRGALARNDKRHAASITDGRVIVVKSIEYHSALIQSCARYGTCPKISTGVVRRRHSSSCIHAQYKYTKYVHKRFTCTRTRKTIIYPHYFVHYHTRYTYSQTGRLCMECQVMMFVYGVITCRVHRAVHSKRLILRGRSTPHGWAGINARQRG